MSVSKVTCPHCSCQLKPRKPLAEGHLVLCRRCGRSFRVPSQALPAQAVQPAPPARAAVQPQAAPSGAHRDTVSSPALVTDTAPHTPVLSTATQTRPVAAPAERSRLLAVLILGGLAATMLLTFLLVLYFAARRPASPATPEQARSGADVAAESGTKGDDSPSPPVSPPGTPEEPWLPPEGQAEVDAAIERGVAFLKAQQDPSGTWGPRDPQHHVGLAALPGLTLLECGVPPDDIRIQKAAEHIRKNVASINLTYDIALSILFLDRLGQEEDRPRIRTLALRLVAGQLASGGWSYGCSLLSGKDENDLENTLALMRPSSPLDLFTQAPATVGAGGGTQAGDRPGNDPSRSQVGAGLDSLANPYDFQKARAALPEHLRRLPALQPPTGRPLPPDGADNSNTQFAILGLWAAGRYNLPLERSLALIVQRFRGSQTPQGGWGYHPGEPPAHAMTCAGLLGLAVGHGLVASRTPNPESKRIPKDPAIEKGFVFVAPLIGPPGPWGAGRPKPQPSGLNMYFMWSMERVGVLYNRRKIDGRDWYGWGARQIVDAQQGDGAWRSGNYPGSIPLADTCFALLFLKRANLAKDLTKKLDLLFLGKKID